VNVGSVLPRVMRISTTSVNYCIYGLVRLQALSSPCAMSLLLRANGACIYKSVSTGAAGKWHAVPAQLVAWVCHPSVEARHLTSRLTFA